MDLTYRSTRGGESGLTASQAILKGMACDGGLFMPDKIPHLDCSIREMAGMTYQETAYQVMKLFFTDFTEQELRTCIDRAYDDKFDTRLIAPLTQADGAWYLELYHGTTIAFKDMALSILPYLMTTAARKNNVDKEIVILTATSGDTGKAALAGFADVEGTRIIVFYPKGGVSRIQELQMVTQKGGNVDVVAVHGNFDDAQSGVKELFADKEFNALLEENGYQFSSANSINIGRLVPQIVYYVYAYKTLLKDGVIEDGEKINITVPTGNFGNILAAYLAKQTGVPIGKLICASNENKVLYDFFKSGTYDRNREFVLTSSPSMDILISSNLERLIYLSAGSDTSKTAELMNELAESGNYTVTEEMRAGMSDFAGGFATQEEDSSAIRTLFEDTGYVIDTHTGVARAVYEKYRRETGDETKTVIASTASPYKFAPSVMEALTGERKDPDADPFSAVDELHEISSVPIPKAIEELRGAEVFHRLECDIPDMKKTVARILKMVYT